MAKLEDMIKHLTGDESAAFTKFVQREQLGFAGAYMHCAYNDVLASTGIRPDKKSVQARELAALDAKAYDAYHGMVHVTGIRPEQSDIEAHLMKVLIFSYDGEYERASEAINVKLTDKQKECIEQLRKECTCYKRGY